MTRSVPATARLRVLCISGPNLQLLGTREPEIYGTEPLASLHARLAARAANLQASVEARQTNHEGTIVDWLGAAKDSGFHGVLLNPGAYGHTSIAILDALRACGLPCVEVHISNPDAREPYRRVSRIAAGCVACVCGFGGDSYLLALEGLVRRLER